MRGGCVRWLCSVWQNIIIRQRASWWLLGLYSEWSSLDWYRSTCNHKYNFKYVQICVVKIKCRVRYMTVWFWVRCPCMAIMQYVQLFLHVPILCYGKNLRMYYELGFKPKILVMQGSVDRMEQLAGWWPIKLKWHSWKLKVLEDYENLISFEKPASFRKPTSVIYCYTHVLTYLPVS